MVLPETEIG